MNSSYPRYQVFEQSTIQLSEKRQ